MSQSPFGEESFEEHGLGKLRKNFWSNSTRQEYAARSLKLQGKITGLGAEHRDENVQSSIAHRTLAGKAGTGDGGRRIRFYHLGCQPLGRLRSACIPQKFENIHQSRPGENALVADVSLIACPQIPEQLELDIVDRSEVRVASL